MTPIEAMKLAIEEAKKGEGWVSPNPLVGCVILDRHHQLLSAGYHARIGEAHAEINALAGVKNKSRLAGAHLFVTLEPCSHQGRTPPCSAELAKWPLASITYGLEDPNPKVSGRGIAELRAARIDVRRLPELTEELEELAEIFLTNMRKGRAFVSLKAATSLDGQMAMKSGQSKWISSEESRAHVQYLRGIHDAVLTGSGTFAADDPKLNARDKRFESKPSKAIVLDFDGKILDLLANSNVLKVRPQADLVLITGNRAVLPKEISDVTHLRLDRFTWSHALSELYRMGICSVLVEGGAQVFSTLLTEGVADRLYLFIAPKLLGAKSGLAWTKDFEIESLDKAPALRNPRTLAFGPDIMVSGRLTPFV